MPWVVLGRNYLRMRGEYSIPPMAVYDTAELPPHARRIQHVECFCAKVIGTTSACAENTMPPLGMPCAIGNYLRMRGEYSE